MLKWKFHTVYTDTMFILRFLYSVGMDAITELFTSMFPPIKEEKYKPENCDLCHKFMASDRMNTNFCDKCTEILDGEQREAELGIGSGSIYWSDKDICRHGINR